MISKEMVKSLQRKSLNIGQTRGLSNAATQKLQIIYVERAATL